MTKSTIYIDTELVPKADESVVILCFCIPTKTDPKFNKEITIILTTVVASMRLSHTVQQRPLLRSIDPILLLRSPLIDSEYFGDY